jgi:hypothetical protein
VVFKDDFDGGRWTSSSVTATFSGVTSFEGVQGFTSTGFRGKLLRNNAQGNPAVATTLTLTGLPKHESINLKFLLALIDTWDGSCGSDRVAAGGALNSTHCPDYFNIALDGISIFQETFFGLSEDAQSYDETKETLLSRGIDLGFNENWEESRNAPGQGPYDLVYDMSREPAFQNIAHRGDTLTLSFYASGIGWQGFADESWAIDNLRIEINPMPTPGLAQKAGAE